MPSAVVTGAAGFIGSNLCEYLLAHDWRVHGIDNHATGRVENVNRLREYDDFTFDQIDVRDVEILSGTDYVFHQAALPSVMGSVDEPDLTTSVNCTGTANVIASARDAGVKKLVIASSAAVYGSTNALPKIETMPTEPESPYALSKLYAEQLAMQADELYSLDTVALRYFNVFGPHQDPDGEYASVIPKFTRQLLEGETPVIYGDGEQTRDFTYVENVVEANLLAIESDVSGEIVNVGTGTQITVNDLLETLNDVLGTEVNPEYDDPRPADVRHSMAGLQRARELLGYEPLVDFEEGIERTVAHYQDVFGG